MKANGFAVMLTVMVHFAMIRAKFTTDSFSTTTGTV